MNRVLKSTLWLFFVIIISAISLSFLDRLEEKRAVQDKEIIMGSTTIYLVAYSGEGHDELGDVGEFETIGCDDILVPYEIPIVSRRLKSILHSLSQFSPPLGLHNPLQEKGLQITDVHERGHTETIISFEGEPKLGGTCDTPRLKAQIDKTVGLYAEAFQIQLNGSAEEYACMGDVKGGCQ